MTVSLIINPDHVVSIESAVQEEQYKVQIHTVIKMYNLALTVDNGIALLSYIGKCVQSKELILISYEEQN